MHVSCSRLGTVAAAGQLFIYIFIYTSRHIHSVVHTIGTRDGTSGYYVPVEM